MQCRRYSTTPALVRTRAFLMQIDRATQNDMQPDAALTREPHCAAIGEFGQVQHPPAQPGLTQQIAEQIDFGRILR